MTADQQLAARDGQTLPQAKNEWKMGAETLWRKVGKTIEKRRLVSWTDLIATTAFSTVVEGFKKNRGERWTA
jgi:hypothetical protein